MKFYSGAKGDLDASHTKLHGLTTSLEKQNRPMNSGKRTVEFGRFDCFYDISKTQEKWRKSN